MMKYQKQEVIKHRGKYKKLITPMLLIKVKRLSNNSLLLTHTSIMKINSLIKVSNRLAGIL